MGHHADRGEHGEQPHGDGPGRSGAIAEPRAESSGDADSHIGKIAFAAADQQGPPTLMWPQMWWALRAIRLYVAVAGGPTVAIGSVPKGERQWPRPHCEAHASCC